VAVDLSAWAVSWHTSSKQLQATERTADKCGVT